MRRINQTLLHLLTAFLLVLLLHGCFNWPSDSGGDQYYPPQTKILNVKVQPDTVAPGDTASFTCVIEDSTDKRFKFYWLTNAGQILDGKVIIENPSTYETASNMTRWIAPDSVGHLISFTVEADNGSEDSSTVDASFSIFIGEN